MKTSVKIEFRAVNLLSLIVLNLWFQMAQVERYEAKLGVMAFMGVFEELMGTVVPVSNQYHSV